MSITVTCSQGHRLKARPEHAGKRVKCPKCKTVVQIPEQPADTQPEELVELSEDPLAQFGPNSDFDPLAGPVNPLDELEDPLGSSALGSPLNSDPLGGSLDQLSEPGAFGTPAPTLTSTTPTTPNDSPPKNTSTNNSKASTKTLMLLAGGVAGSVAFLLTLVAGLGLWFMLDGGESPVTDPVTVTSSTQAEDGATSDNTAGTPATEDDIALHNSAQPNRDRKATTNPQPPAVAPPTPEEIAEKRLAAKKEAEARRSARQLLEVKFPATSWGAAYDEVSGHLAVTNDDQGVVIYSIEELLASNALPEPKATFAVEGLPTCVCLKPLKDKRLLLVTSDGGASVDVYDMSSLEKIDSIPLADLEYVRFITSGNNSDDPFAYYITQPNRDRRKGNKLGRVNLETKAQEGHTADPFMDLQVSPDGHLLYVRPTSTANGVIATWTNREGRSGGIELEPLSTWNRSRAMHPVYPLGQQMGYGYSVCGPMLRAATARGDFRPMAAFDDRAIIVGLSAQEIVFASANTYERLASFPLRTDRLRPKSTSQNVTDDTRERYQLSPVIKSGFFDVQVDNKRGLGLIITGEHLTIASLEKNRIKTEPSLALRTTLPDKVIAGTSVEFDLQAEAEGVTFAYVPNTKYLPDEKVRLLGTLPPGEPSPKPLALDSSVSEDQDYIVFENTKALVGLKSPIKLKVGKEIMIGTKFKGYKLGVKRTKRMRHFSGARIEVIGQQIKIPQQAAVLEGTRIELVAAVNATQNVIYVEDAGRLEGKALPAALQIGGETMMVTGVDDFKNALEVERNNPSVHSVTSIAVLLNGPVNSSVPVRTLPTLQGNVLRWTPSVDLIGTQRIRIQSRLGDLTRESFWDVEIVRESVDAPFYVVGIEATPGIDQAVVWGKSTDPNETGDKDDATPAPREFVGIYDVQQKKVTNHVEVKSEILTATIDSTGVYVAIATSGEEEPYSLVRFDATTLKEQHRQTIPQTTSRLLCVAGRYLATLDSQQCVAHRLEIPSLKPVKTELPRFSYPVSGQLRDGWVWDGIVWDAEMKQPQLLLFPIHFAPPTGGREEPRLPAHGKGVITSHPYGPHVSTWQSINHNLRPRDCRSLTQHAAGITCDLGMVQVYSWSKSSVVHMGSRRRPDASVRLISSGYQLGTIAEDLRSRNDEVLQRLRGYTTEANGVVFVVLQGKIYTVALDELVQDEEKFVFEEKQDKFVLDPSKPMRVSYNAPGATRYHLQAWFQRPSFNQEPVFSAASDDGTFEIVLQDQDQLVTRAMSVAGRVPRGRSINDKIGAITKYLTNVTPAYRSLTRKKLKGVPFPLYVSVTAEHADGRQKAGLAHAYLIEVPTRAIQSVLTRGS